MSTCSYSIQGDFSCAVPKTSIKSIEGFGRSVSSAGFATGRLTNNTGQSTVIVSEPISVPSEPIRCCFNCKQSRNSKQLHE